MSSEWINTYKRVPDLDGVTKMFRIATKLEMGAGHSMVIAFLTLNHLATSWLTTFSCEAERANPV